MAQVKTNMYFGDLTSSMKSTGKVFSFGGERNVQWVDMEDDDGEVCDSGSEASSSSFSDSNLSVSCSASSSSSDLVEDASSSLTSCSSFESSTPSPPVSKGPLYELSELMIQLPIKRGLSKHFQGKSQSFTSLSNVKCLEDLAKKEASPCRNKMMKACKSYGGGLDTQKHLSPRSCSNKTISKGSFFSSSLHGGSKQKKKSSGFINSGSSSSSRSRPPLCGQIKTDLVIS